jgi:hypothetical protein
VEVGVEAERLVEGEELAIEGPHRGVEVYIALGVIDEEVPRTISLASYERFVELPGEGFLDLGIDPPLEAGAVASGDELEEHRFLLGPAVVVLRGHRHASAGVEARQAQSGLAGHR